MSGQHSHTHAHSSAHSHSVTSLVHHHGHSHSHPHPHPQHHSHHLPLPLPHPHPAVAVNSTREGHHPTPAATPMPLDTPTPGPMHCPSGRSSIAPSRTPTPAHAGTYTIGHNGGRNNEVRSVMLFGVPIIALVMDGQERLCLAQISNTLLKNFSYNEIHNRRVALGITCVQCTPVQLELLRRAGAMPVSSRRCGMITKREAERLCKSFLQEARPPKLPDTFAFEVSHHCAWGCRGNFVPSRYNSSRAKCIKCVYCGLFFSPNKFIFHSHRLPESKYVQPDAANFNSWRRHIRLYGSPSDDVSFAWEDVKAMFNGGSRKRSMSATLHSLSRSPSKRVASQGDAAGESHPPKRRSRGNKTTAAMARCQASPSPPLGSGPCNRGGGDKEGEEMTNIDIETSERSNSPAACRMSDSLSPQSGHSHSRSTPTPYQPATLHPIGANQPPPPLFGHSSLAANFAAGFAATHPYMPFGMPPFAKDLTERHGPAALHYAGNAHQAMAAAAAAAAMGQAMGNIGQHKSGNVPMDIRQTFAEMMWSQSAAAAGMNKTSSAAPTSTSSQNQQCSPPTPHPYNFLWPRPPVGLSHTELAMGLANGFNHQRANQTDPLPSMNRFAASRSPEATGPPRPAHVSLPPSSGTTPHHQHLARRWFAELQSQTQNQNMGQSLASASAPLQAKRSSAFKPVSSSVSQTISTPVAASVGVAERKCRKRDFSMASITAKDDESPSASGDERNRTIEKLSSFTSHSYGGYNTSRDQEELDIIGTDEDQEAGDLAEREVSDAEYGSDRDSDPEEEEEAVEKAEAELQGERTRVESEAEEEAEDSSTSSAEMSPRLRPFKINDMNHEHIELNATKKPMRQTKM